MTVSSPSRSYTIQLLPSAPPMPPPAFMNLFSGVLATTDSLGAVMVGGSLPAQTATLTVAQAIPLQRADGTTANTVIFAANAAVATNAASSPYLRFPAIPPPPVTGVPVIRLIIHNNSSNGTVIQPTLLNADGSQYAGNGGNLPRIEPGNRTTVGGTSWGMINMSVPGVPTSSMRLALQNLQVGDATGFAVSVLAWAA